MGVLFLLDQTKTTSEFVDADPTKSVKQQGREDQHLLPTQLNEESESEDDDGDEDTTVDDSSADSDASNASPSSFANSNPYSYEGSEEHKFEC
ncbi:hypothetical protein PR001_g26756 [Phytophthora rubi]|uniref:Uncharacterized protein n=1 Tax=Phytophthora rubi TaxID=129364 RepID=A0A6A3HQH7_9STRA|nr:hypothetical protein PR001_g26756 [Phytophthora rubi]